MLSRAHERFFFSPCPFASSVVCRTVSKIKGNICQIFSPRIYNSPLRGSPWNFVTVVGLETARMMPYQNVKKNVTIFPLALDRQTDTIGQNNIPLCMHCMLTRELTHLCPRCYFAGRYQNTSAVCKEDVHADRQASESDISTAQI